MKKPKTGRFKIFILGAVFAPLLFGGYFYTQEYDNFHPITEGEAYRSAQLEGNELEYYIQKYGIRSVVNLRGEHPTWEWYRDEVAAGKKHGVKHYDIGLSASREPSEEKMRKIEEIIQEAPRPVLIHCRAGADRSGLVAAMWKVAIDKEPKSEAQKQLSIVYGHLPMGRNTAMDRSFQNWSPDGISE